MSGKVLTHQKRVELESGHITEIPKAQRRSIGKPLDNYVANYSLAKDGMRAAYATGYYTMQQIAKAFDVHYSTVSRAVNK